MIEKVFNMFGLYTRKQYFKLIRENNRLALSLQVSEEMKVDVIRKNRELEKEIERLRVKVARSVKRKKRWDLKGTNTTQKK